MMLDAERQQIVDTEHLRALSICYMVFAGFHAFFSLFGLFYASIGAMMGTLVKEAAKRSADQPPPELFMYLFGFFGLAIFVLFMGWGILQFIAARRLLQRRSRIFCMVVAGITSVGIPLGTVLAVLSFLVLVRPSVIASFDRPDAAAPASPAAPPAAVSPDGTSS